MKKTIPLLAILFTALAFSSCDKERGTDEEKGTIVNNKNIEGKTWVADKTVYLLNGKPSGEKEGLKEGEFGGVQSLSFKDGYVTLGYGESEEYMFAYVLEDNVLKIISGFGPVFRYEVKNSNDEELIITWGETTPYIIDESEDSAISQEHIVANVNNTDIYHKAVGNQYNSSVRMYYYSSAKEPTLCKLYAYSGGHLSEDAQSLFEKMIISSYVSLSQEEKSLLLQICDSEFEVDSTSYYYHWTPLCDRDTGTRCVSYPEMISTFVGFSKYALGEERWERYNSVIQSYGASEDASNFAIFQCLNEWTDHYQFVEFNGTTFVPINSKYVLDDFFDYYCLIWDDLNRVSGGLGIPDYFDSYIYYGDDTLDMLCAFYDRITLKYGQQYSIIEFTKYVNEKVEELKNQTYGVYANDWRLYKYYMDHYINLQEHFFYDGRYEWHLKEQ